MMPKSGFVLLTVVVMLSVITGLILAQNKMIQLAMRRQHLYANSQSREAELDAVTEQLVLGLMSTKAQLDSQRAQGNRLKMNPRFPADQAVVNDTMLQKQLVEQGQDYAKHYRYLMSDLGDYPCMKLSGSHASHHWLLSLLDTEAPTRILILRIATPIQEQPCIEHPVAYHPVGLLSWRSRTIG